MTFKTYNIYSPDIEIDDIGMESTNATTPLSIMKVPQIYDYHDLGVFCKFDVGLDKGSKMALRFRLGTVGGVDELERKGPTRYNY